MLSPYRRHCTRCRLVLQLFINAVHPGVLDLLALQSSLLWYRGFAFSPGVHFPLELKSFRVLDCSWKAWRVRSLRHSLLLRSCPGRGQWIIRFTFVSSLDQVVTGRRLRKRADPTAVPVSNGSSRTVPAGKKRLKKVATRRLNGEEGPGTSKRKPLVVTEGSDLQELTALVKDVLDRVGETERELRRLRNEGVVVPKDRVCPDLVLVESRCSRYR